MFENIIGHAPVVSELRREIQGGTLPQAVLITGPELSGKGSIALEVARSLSCATDEAPWNCDCSSCSLHRVLQNPETIVLGPRDFASEIVLSAGTLLSDPRPARVYLFIRAVRKLMLRCDTRFWPEKRISSLIGLLESLSEALSAVEPPLRLPEEAELRERTVNAIVDQALTLVGKLPSELVPVDMVRNLATWTHTNAAQGKKIVILEEAHALQEAARNAMLKILEEPPRDCYFIMTSSRPGAIIPTILSRLRRYDLSERTMAEQRSVQTRVFAVDEPRDSLRAFFRSSVVPDTLDAEAMVERLRRRVEGVPVEEESLLSDFDRLSDAIGSRTAFGYLTESVLEQLDSATADAAMRERYRFFSREMLTHTDWIVQRNMNPHQVYRNLLFSLDDDEGWTAQ